MMLNKNSEYNQFRVWMQRNLFILHNLTISIFRNDATKEKKEEKTKYRRSLANFTYFSSLFSVFCSSRANIPHTVHVPFTKKKKKNKETLNKSIIYLFGVLWLLCFYLVLVVFFFFQITVRYCHTKRVHAVGILNYYYYAICIYRTAAHTHTVVALIYFNFNHSFLDDFSRTLPIYSVAAYESVSLKFCRDNDGFDWMAKHAHNTHFIDTPRSINSDMIIIYIFLIVINFTIRHTTTKQMRVHSSEWK